MVNLQEIDKLVNGHTVIRNIDQVRRGHIRLETAFRYPDGGAVDLFIVEAPTLKRQDFTSRKLSDLGGTQEWLLDVQVKPWLSKKRQAILDDAIRIYGVTQEGGALEIQLQDLNELVDKVVVLGQACIRVADLTYTRRSSLQVPVVEEIEEVLIDAEVPYEPNAELVGRFGRTVRVDILAHGNSIDSAILSLASANSSAAHTQANEIFRRWYDLDIPKRGEQKITVYDDRYDAYKDDDLSRLENISQVVPLSDRQMIADLLAA